MLDGSTPTLRYGTIFAIHLVTCTFAQQRKGLVEGNITTHAMSVTVDNTIVNVDVDVMEDFGGAKIEMEFHCKNKKKVIEKTQHKDTLAYVMTNWK